jgi:hypothetical protein
VVCTLIGNVLSCDGFWSLFMYASTIALTIILQTHENEQPIISCGAVYLITRPIRTCGYSGSSAFEIATTNSSLCFFSLLVEHVAVYSRDLPHSAH